MQPVAHKNVAGVVVVVFHQVAGLAGEDDEAAIRADERGGRSAIAAIGAQAVNADQLRRAGLQVFDKEVVDARPGALAFKCNQPAIGAHGGIKAISANQSIGTGKKIEQVNLLHGGAVFRVASAKSEVAPITTEHRTGGAAGESDAIGIGAD